MQSNIENYQRQVALARTEIKNLRQQLQSLKYEHLTELRAIKAILNDPRCTNCADKATSLSNPQTNPTEHPSTSQPDKISFKPIGYVETTFLNKRGVPRQPTLLTKSKGTVVIDPTVFSNPEHALSGLEEFSHMWIIFHFHATDSINIQAKVCPPRLGGERRGVFATRSPHRACPIGLSLVKIQTIEGNKIHFLGVDMVNKTPVLDIKPYIPQYDYPALCDSATPRPPTEGISDAVDADRHYDYGRSPSPCITNPLDIDTSSPTLTYETPSPSYSTPLSPLDSSSRMDLGSIRPETERGAPDGQERFTPPQSASLANASHDGIRVASWISNPTNQTFEVRFLDDALERLEGLIGERATAFKNNIQSLLSDDPRSNYVKTRYPNHEYSCVLEDLSISCVFDTNSSVCTIVAVRSADEMQQC